MTPDWVKEIINGSIMGVEVKADSRDPEAIQVIRFKIYGGKTLVLTSLAKSIEGQEHTVDYIAVRVEVPK